MKTTLVVNGSPRTDGFSSAVAEYIKKRLDACTVISPDVRHCTGCDMCRAGECVINDDMQAYYGLIRDADNIIFVSPLYFSMLTGKMLTFASRWQYFYRRPCTGQKNGAVILLGGGSTKDTQKAFSTAKIIMRYAGIEEPQLAAFVGTDSADPLKDKDFLNKLDEITKKASSD